MQRLERAYGIYKHFQFSGVPEPTDVDWHWWGKLNAAGHGAVVVLRGSGGRRLPDGQHSLGRGATPLIA